MKTEIIFSLKWHFEAKSLSLRNALGLRCPLSVEQTKSLRLYYSDYFSHLISATDLLLEKKYPYRKLFGLSLKEKFIFPGHLDGDLNYSFIRELRNSIIHRGFDVTSFAHVVDSVPMIVAPLTTENDKGTKSYKRFGYYILEVIDKCESTLGLIIADHLFDVGALTNTIDQHQAVDASRRYVNESEIPPWVKEAAFDVLGGIDFEAVRNSQVESLLVLLKINTLRADA